VKRASLWLLVVIVTCSLVGLTVSTAFATSNIVPMAEIKYPFYTTVPAFGTCYDRDPEDPDFEPFIMSNGKYVKCQLDYSGGGRAIDVRVVRVSDETPLSTWKDVDNGETVYLWTNDTGMTQYVMFELTSTWPLATVVQGYWVFGPF